MKPRLSMKLLWKMLTEYQKTEEYKVAQRSDTLQISRFLEFVESELKKTPTNP